MYLQINPRQLSCTHKTFYLYIFIIWTRNKYCRHKKSFFYIVFRIRVILPIDPGVQTFHCAKGTRRIRLKTTTTFPIHHFSSMKTYGMLPVMHVATLHWMRYLVEIILFFPMIREKHEARDHYSSMSRGFPQDRQLFYHHKRTYRVKNLYSTRTNVCARVIVARRWLKSSGKPLNENPCDATSRLWAGNC